MQYVQRDWKSEKEKMRVADIRDFDLSTSQIEHLIDEWIFSERDRYLLKRRLLDNIGFECLAEEFGLSVRHTQTIVYKGLERIIRHIPTCAE
jgi:hypothetical protein